MPPELLFLYQNLVYHSVIKGFLRCHPVIPVAIGRYLLYRLPRMLGNYLIKFVLGLGYLPRRYLYIRSLALRAAQRLVYHRP